MKTKLARSMPIAIENHSDLSLKKIAHYAFTVFLFARKTADIPEDRICNRAAFFSIRNRAAFFSSLFVVHFIFFKIAPVHVE